MNRDELAALILLELHRRCEAIRTRPKPPDWKTWEARPDAVDREYGRVTHAHGSAMPPAPRPAGCACSAPSTAWKTPGWWTS